VLFVGGAAGAAAWNVTVLTPAAPPEVCDAGAGNSVSLVFHISACVCVCVYVCVPVFVALPTVMCCLMYWRW